MATYIDPERPQFDEFKALPRDVPIMMLNLIRLREQAVYPDGRSAGSGADAYAAYGRESGPIFERLGGEIIWRGRPEIILIGPRELHWDIAFIARYPTAAAFLAMVTDPDYKRAVLHRQAAALDTRLIRFADLAHGAGFSG